MRRSLLLLLFAAVALASCGGGDDSEDVEGLLDQAFGGEIRSADLKLDAELRLKGSPALQRPVRLQASGPFIAGRDSLPSADIEVKVGTEGGGQTITGGLLLTGDRAFVKFQDVYYERPAAEVRRANRRLRRNRGSESSLAELGFRPRIWLADARDEGEAEVDGVQTRHLSGRLDVDAVLRDFNRFVRKSGSTLRGATGQTPPERLSPGETRVIAAAVDDPTFDVYTGEEDGVIRRVSGRLEFKVPVAARARLDGVESGSLEFSMEFGDVNGAQRVEAPAKARPLSALTRSLGGGSALEGLGAGIDAPEGDEEAEPAPPGSLPPDEQGPAPEADDFREYADCLDKAPPEDTDALQRCADLVQGP